MTPIRTYNDAWNGAIRAHRRTGIAVTDWALPLERPVELPESADIKPASRNTQKDRRAGR